MPKPCSSIEAPSFTRPKMSKTPSAYSSSRRIAAMKSFVKSLNCSACATARKSPTPPGVIGLTDVLDADRQLLAAKDDLAVARESAARAAVGSYRALGGGWLP